MYPIIGFIGPSGSGKTTLILELLNRFPDIFGAVRSLTTRASRGADDALFFDFKTHNDILQLKTKNKLFQISSYAGNFYANDRESVDNLLTTKIGLMAIVEQGIKNFRAAGYRVIVVRIIPQDAPPSPDIARQHADAERAKEHFPADLTITNSFLPGGKEKALQELTRFINNIMLHVNR